MLDINGFHLKSKWGSKKISAQLKTIDSSSNHSTVLCLLAHLYVHNNTGGHEFVSYKI